MTRETKILNEMDSQGSEFPAYDMQYGQTLIRLFVNGDNWAMVFDNICYNMSGGRYEREFIYIGNCIQGVRKINEYSDHLAIYPLVQANEMSHFIDEQGFVYKNGRESVIINGQNIELSLDPDLFKEQNILKDYDQELAVEHILRYLCEVKKGVFNYSDSLIFNHLPASMPEIMKIEEWHIEYLEKPSMSETYQMIAKILATKDTSYWKPTLLPNSNWRAIDAR